MSTTAGTMTLRLEIAQDLSAVMEMFANLRDEAVNRAGDPDIPGGAAMVMLGPGADIEAFGYAQMSELMGRTSGSVWMPDKGDLEPPLSFLASWADIVREARGFEPSQRRASIGGEVSSLRSALDWMLSVNEDGEPWFIEVEDFAKGLSKIRRAMENVLHDGIRAERIRAECKACDESPRLCIRRDSEPISFYCPSCRKDYDADGVGECWHRMIAKRADAIPEWVTIAQASAATGRPAKTIRNWIVDKDHLGNDKTPKVTSRRVGDLVEVNWEEVRKADDKAKRRTVRQVVA